MEVSKTFRYISIFVILFNVMFVITTVMFVILCFSKLQFWRLESIVFKNDLFKLTFCMKIQVFIDLFCTLLNNYALNIASKTLLRFTSMLLICGMAITITFMCLIIYSYKRNYPHIIENGYILDMEIRAFIDDRYVSMKDKVTEGLQKTKSKILENDKMCIAEFDQVSDYILLFLYISLGVLIVTYLFTKLFIYIKISKSKKEVPEMQNIRRAAMSTGSLKKLKVVTKK